MEPLGISLTFLLVLLTVVMVGAVLITLSAVYFVQNWRKTVIVQQKQEASLQRSEKRYEELFNNTSDIVFTHSLDGIIEEINYTATQELGYSYNEIVGHSMLEFVLPERNPLIGNYFEGVRRLGEFSGLIEIQTKSGEIRIYDYRSNLGFENGVPTAVLGIARDVTERILARNKLMESEERYREFFEQDLTGDFITNKDGIITACNPAFIEMFLFDSLEEAIEKPFSSMFKSEEMYEKCFDKINKQKQLTYYETELIDKNGNSVYVVANLIAIYNKDEQFSGIRGYLFNNSKRKSLESQVLQYQKMQGIGTLAGGVAHDFNNILSIIKFIMIELQSSKDIDDAVFDEYTHQVLQAVDRGADLVKQILTFARKADITFKPINVNTVIQETITLASKTFPKSIILKTVLDENISMIRADQGQIYQAILNLLVNARDAIIARDVIPNNGEITITTQGVGVGIIQKMYPKAKPVDHIRISISDSGSGINPETLERLFEPFYTTKERNKGTGLGLSVVYGIVSSHLGHIDVDSTVNVGTTFHLYFPITDEQVVPEEPKHTVSPIESDNNETILIVEDEDQLVDMLDMTFSDNGYQTIIAKDGIEAIEMFEAHKDKIDIVFSDSGLPRLSGIEAVIHMRKAVPNLRVIFASGYFDPDVKTQMYNEGVRNFVQKPYSPVQILQVVKEVLEQKA